MKRIRSAAFVLCTTIVWAIVGAAAALAAATSFPSIAGYQSLTVLTGSMEPALETGSITLNERISPLDARPGDIVTFPDPENNERLITHRLRRVTVERGVAHMVTRGDANDAAERWDVAVDAQIGRVGYHLPKVGHARTLFSGPIGRGLVLLALLAWGGLTLIDVWKPPRMQEAQADAA